MARHTHPDSQRKRRAGAASSASSFAGGARLAALICAGCAAIAVEMTMQEGMRGEGISSVGLTSHYAISAAGPTFFLTLLCFERLQHPTWLSALFASWPWSLGIVCSALALMPHRRPWPLLLVLLAAIGLDYRKTFRNGSEAMSRDNK